jgi:hypothetical protein
MMMEAQVLAESGPRWLDQRSHPDLPSEAERALRLAGLAWQREMEAEAHLARAAELAPDHLAVLIAHYRYHFYKHHYDRAERFARRCLDAVATEIGIPCELEAVRSDHADFMGDDPLVRFWLFAMQAYGYVLLRLGQEARGKAVLEKVTTLDALDKTKTRVLLQVMAQAGTDDES